MEEHITTTGHFPVFSGFYIGRRRGERMNSGEEEGEQTLGGFYLQVTNPITRVPPSWDPNTSHVWVKFPEVGEETFVGHLDIEL
jgi:hypothetical protein